MTFEDFLGDLFSEQKWKDIGFGKKENTLEEKISELQYQNNDIQPSAVLPLSSKKERLFVLELIFSWFFTYPL